MAAEDSATEREIERESERERERWLAVGRQALSTHLGLSRVLVGLYQNLAHSDNFADGRDGRLQDLPGSQDGHSTEPALVTAPRIFWTLHCVHHHSLQGQGG